MEKNDAGLRFAFGVTAITTDRKASNRSRTSSGRLRALNSVWTISLSYYCVDTFRGKKNHIENEKKRLLRFATTRSYQLVLQHFC